jgi:hypothetical protein
VTKDYVLGVSDYSTATWTQNFIASVAGAVASITIAAPLDVVKTRIQNANFEHNISGFTVMKDLFKHEGPLALFKGLTPKVGGGLTLTFRTSLTPIFRSWSSDPSWYSATQLHNR